MNNNENSVDILNDFIKINNDRIAGYQKALDESKVLDLDLKTLFTRMINDSSEYAEELGAEVNKLGGEVITGTTLPGKIYRAWMDVKNTFTGKDRHAILESCEFGEDAAQKAYKEALKSDDLNPDLHPLITAQKSALLESHNIIKGYRDIVKEVS